MTERELLRLHIEAVWNLTLPPLDASVHDVELSQTLPPWSLYLAGFAQEQVAIWHASIPSKQRLPLLKKAQEADVIWEKALEMRREVVFADPNRDPEQQAHAQQRARVLTGDDTDLLNTFEPNSASIFLKPRNAPCIGTIVDGRLMSVAHSSRQTPVACELGIDTLPEARRRGYATAATILWTAIVQQKGLIPIYSAYADNTASLRLATASGYRHRIDGVYGPVPEDAG